MVSRKQDGDRGEAWRCKGEHSRRKQDVGRALEAEAWDGNRPSRAPAVPSRPCADLDIISPQVPFLECNRMRQVS